jgi:polyhydroxybutyrate depolymerase
VRWLPLAIVVAACGSSKSHAPRQDAAIDAPDAGNVGPCGIRGAMRGLQPHTMMLGGLNRTYLVYLPAGDAQAAMPLVLVFHGYTMSGQNMYDVTAYKAIADAMQVALAFPDGEAGPNSLGAPWNVGANVCPSAAGAPPSASGDDLAFADAMRADIAQDQCIDGAHVYITGFSMGGYFSHHAGCMHPGIRAVAPHSGGTHALDTCANAHEPIIIFHGLSDPVIPDGCDDPNASSVPSGVTPSAKAWAQHNGCATTATTMMVQGGSCAYYDGCPAGGQVALCTFSGMGHCWAGGSGSFGCPNYASATQLEWQFFKQYAW